MLLKYRGLGRKSSNYIQTKLQYQKNGFYLKSSHFQMLTAQPEERKERQTKQNQNMIKQNISKESLRKKVHEDLFYKKFCILAYNIKETLPYLKN